MGSYLQALDLMKIPKHLLARYYSFYLPSLKIAEWQNLPDPVSSDFLRQYWRQSRRKDLPPLPTLTQLEALFRQWEQNYQVIDFTQAEYPSEFLLLEDAPLSFFAQGNLRLLTEQQRIGVVGSRKLRASVEDWSELHLQAFLKSYRPIVVSGAAQGVDRLAHELALRCRCQTIALLPCGLDEIYPESFSQLKPRLLEQGALLLSEYLPSEKVRKHYFVQRNRLIVALARLVLVLQAERRSGSMLTANIARGMDREIAALPGDPTDPVFWGSNDLLAEGAHFLRDRDDVLGLYQRYVKPAPQQLQFL